MLNVHRRNRAYRNRGGRMKPLPWRTVLFGDETGRFSREQLGRAVLTVMESRRLDRPMWPMAVHEPRREWGTPSPPREPHVPPAEPVPYQPRRRGGRRRKAPPAEG